MRYGGTNLDLTPIQALAFSSDAKLLAFSTCDPFEKGEVKLWETAYLLNK